MTLENYPGSDERWRSPVPKSFSWNLTKSYLDLTGYYHALLIQVNRDILH